MSETHLNNVALNSLDKEKKYLVAVSGGVDSMALAHYLHTQGYNIVIAHCNFKLRASASDQDELLVRTFAKKHNILLHCISFKTEEIANKSKESIQITARKLRYNWFSELLSSNGYEKLVTAHHLDDQTETFIYHITKGTGIKGLLGIPKQTETTIRPFIEVYQQATQRNNIFNVR